MKSTIWLTLILVGTLVISGCSGTFQAKKTTPVSTTTVVSGYTAVAPNVGILYDYFSTFNAFNPVEANMAYEAYTGMIRLIEKLQKKTVAGQADYHRLKYFAEDFTEYWEDLRTVLDQHVAAELPGRNLYAEALYIEVRGKVDNMLELTNLRLRHVEGDMDKAAYLQFRTDALNVVKVISPLIKAGALAL